MDLYHFHRVLISTVILFAAGFAVYSFRRFSNAGHNIDLISAIASGVIAIALSGYLVYFNRVLHNLHHTDPERPTTGDGRAT